MAHEKLVREGEEAIKKGIKPAEVEDYFKKKGMDKKEAKEEITKLQASRIVQEARKAEAAKKSAHAAADRAGKAAAPEKKSSFWFWFIILLIIGIIVYLFYAGYISPDIFKNMNFKLPSFSK